jgi:acyl carrier protein
MNELELKKIILNGLAAVAPGADVNGLDPDENVREALDIDSFDHLNFLVGLHDQLGVDIPEKDYGRLNTVNEIIGYLMALRV